MGKNQKMGKKNQKMAKKNLIWNHSLMYLVMTVNGISVMLKPSTWVRSNVKASNVCFTAWMVSWLKVTKEQNVKRTKMVSGNGTKNSEPVLNVVTTVQS